MPNDPQFFPPEEESEGHAEINEVNESAIAALNRSEHAAMVHTANHPANRRKLDDFDKKLHTYATHSQAVALSMFYSLPRAGKQIIGASIRFAEVVVPCWKNCAAGVRMIGDTRETVTAQGNFIDYEANVRISVESQRRITDKNGNRFNADMIVTTANAASSIAYRNAVLRGVPRALWNPAYQEAMLTAVGKAKSHSERVASAMEYLTKLGITEWQIMNSIGCASDKDMEVEHLVTLKVLCEEIKRGDKTIEEVFGSPYDKEIDSLFRQLGINAAAQGLLRSSYMGRAKDLVEHLRGRLEPSGKSSPKRAEPQPQAQPAAAQPTQAADTQQEQPQSKRGRGRPRKEQGPTLTTQPDDAEQGAEPEQAEGAQAAQEQAPPTDKFNF